MSHMLPPSAMQCVLAALHPPAPFLPLSSLQPDEHYMDTSQGIMRQLGFLDADNELKASRCVHAAITLQNIAAVD